MKSVIKTNKAPKAIGSYSQAVKINNLLFVSGQIPFVPETMKLVSDNVKEQAQQSMENIKNILEASGTTMNNIVKTTIFLQDMNSFKEIDKVYGQYFDGEYPSRACVEVSRLPKDVKVEIEVIAEIN